MPRRAQAWALSAVCRSSCAMNESLISIDARRNGRAFASLTARGGGLPVGVTLSSPLLEPDLLGVLFLTARTSISRLPTTTRGVLLARPHTSQADASSGRLWCGPL